MKTADQILKMTKPGDLFVSDASALRNEYKKLAKIWHPDVHEDPDTASKVMTKINDLYETGLEMIKQGTWSQSNMLYLKSTSGQLHKIKYFKGRPFELGMSYMCNTIVVYVLDKRHRAYYENFLKRASELRYQDAEMKTEFERYMPHVRANFETDQNLVIVIDKPVDVLSLHDILEHYNGVMPDRHMAWVLSTMYHLACFLNFNGLSHNGITLDNYFICPSKHSGLLLGGWMYTVEQGEKMLGAPRSVFENMSYKTKADKLGSISTDLDCIRQLGRQLCGDISGRNLSSSKLPKPVLDWLLGASTKGAVEEYASWYGTLDAGYGPRKFVDMPIATGDLYPVQ